MLTTGKAGRKEVAVVLTLWGVLMVVGMAAVALLNANAHRLIHNIEVVRASRHQRALALYEEMSRHARRVLEKYAEANAGQKPAAIVPADDPDYKSAIELFNKAWGLDARDPYAPERREHYDLMAHVHDAAGHGIEREQMLAKAMIAAGTPKLALPHVQAALTSAPQDIAVLTLAAETALRAGERDQLENLLGQMQAHEAATAPLAEFRARIALDAGEVTTATELFQQAVRAAPANIGLRKRLADIYAGAQDWRAAAAVLKDGLAHGGQDDPGYLHLYGMALLAVDEPAQAIPVLREAARLEPSSASVKWDLARAYQKTGNARRAHESLRDAIRLDPNLQGRILR